jgi:glyceraldehyde 3-phosphate dehydrogenase
MIRIAINGFGRIGRTFFRKLITQNDIELVGINDLTAPSTLAHLLKYDSIHGKFPQEISYTEHSIIVNGKEIPVSAIKAPELLPWKALNVDLVIESTGHFTEAEKAALHIKAGAKKVIISAPGTGNLKTIVPGVNHDILTDDDLVVSCASCTTNNAAPMVKLIDENFEIQSAYLTTVHAYTGDQNLHDSPHKDLRRARAAAHSIIPTSTGAAKAIAEVFTHLSGKIGGAGIRVPVIDGSLTDMVCTVSKSTTVEEVNAIFKKAAANELKGILEYTEEPLVSVDIIGNNNSCVFDSQLTSVLGDGKLVKIVGWYDNESGYSTRLVDLARMMIKK